MHSIANVIAFLFETTSMMQGVVFTMQLRKAKFDLSVQSGLPMLYVYLLKYSLQI